MTRSFEGLVWPTVVAITLCALFLVLDAELEAQQPCFEARLLETLSFGGISGDADLNPVHAAAEGPEGRLYLIQVFIPTIQAFDSGGRLVSTIGRSGQGPGEFSADPNILGFRADTLWVSTRLATHFFGPDGREMRRVRFNTAIPEEASTFSAGVPLPDGTMLGYRAYHPPVDGFFLRKTLPLLRFSEVGEVLDTIVVVDQSPVVIGGETDPQGQHELVIVHPLGIPAYRESSGLPVALAPDGTFVVHVRYDPEGHRDEFELLKVGIEGDTLLRLVVPYERRPISRDERQQLGDAFAAWAGGDAPSFRNRTPPPVRERRRRLARESLTFPDDYPPVRDLFVGHDGSIWLKREGWPLPADVWEIRDSASGVVVARFVVRDGIASNYFPWSGRLRILVARRDELWATTVDEFDLPTVHRYRVIRDCG